MGCGLKTVLQAPRRLGLCLHRLLPQRPAQRAAHQAARYTCAEPVLHERQVKPGVGHLEVAAALGNQRTPCDKAQAKETLQMAFSSLEGGN